LNVRVGTLCHHSFSCPSRVRRASLMKSIDKYFSLTWFLTEVHRTHAYIVTKPKLFLHTALIPRFRSSVRVLPIASFTMKESIVGFVLSCLTMRTGLYVAFSPNIECEKERTGSKSTPLTDRAPRRNVRDC
jgi:hypothetical protein